MFRAPEAPADYLPSLDVAAATESAAPVMQRHDQAEDAAPPERQRAVTLAGTVDRNPTLTKTPKGRPLAFFPLTVTGEDETVEHHSVLAFDTRAQKARTGVRRGDDVEVIGYPHPREVKQADGSTVTVSEIYAVRVIRTSDRKAVV
jgi:hypothetical protein